MGMITDEEQTAIDLVDRVDARVPLSRAVEQLQSLVYELWLAVHTEDERDRRWIALASATRVQHIAASIVEAAADGGAR